MIETIEKVKVLKLKSVSIDMHQGINTVTESVQYLDFGVPIIQSKNITSGFLNLEDVRYLSEKDYLKYKQKYQPSPDDVLVCNIGTIGKSLRIKEFDRFLIAWNLFIIKLDRNLIYSQYFAHYLNHLAELNYFDRFLTGGTVKFINKKTMQDIPIPLPPLPTQKKIAAILDAADVYRQKTKILIDKYDQLAQSLFLDMFGDPVRNEKGWEKVKLSSIVSKLATGKSLNSVDENEAGDYKVLKTSSVSWGEFKEKEAKFLPFGYVAPIDHLIKKGDLLISRMNTTDLVGASAYVHCETKNLALPDRIWKFVWKNSDNQNTLFIWYTINKESFREQISKTSSGTSGSMKNISKEKILKLDIISPPITLQNQFAERIQLIEAQKQQAQASLQKAEDLFNSLLQSAFRGGFGG